MPLTKQFKETVKERAERDEKFRQAILTESLQCFLEGDVETGKSILRDYINATVGFKDVGLLIDKNDKSVMRMLSRSGNPTTNNLFSIIQYLQDREGIKLQVRGVH